MGNLATLADVENVLIRPITDADEVAAVEFNLLVVSSAIRNYCEQTLDRVTGDVVTLDQEGGPLLFLPELPVVSVSAVRENGTLLTVGTHYKLTGNGVLVRQGGLNWYRGVQTVQVTYTHGYNPVPDDIRGVCARAASRLFQAGLRAEETGGVLGIASKSLGDFSVAYSGESSAAEGLMGASGARVLALSEKDILNKYKL